MSSYESVETGGGAVGGRGDRRYLSYENSPSSGSSTTTSCGSLDAQNDISSDDGTSRGASMDAANAAITTLFAYGENDVPEAKRVRQDFEAFRRQKKQEQRREQTRKLRERNQDEARNRLMTHKKLRRESEEKARKAEEEARKAEDLQETWGKNSEHAAHENRAKAAQKTNAQKLRHEEEARKAQDLQEAWKRNSERAAHENREQASRKTRDEELRNEEEARKIQELQKAWKKNSDQQQQAMAHDNDNNEPQASGTTAEIRERSKEEDRNRQEAYKKLREQNEEEVRQIQQDLNTRELDEEMARREREQEEMLRELELRDQRREEEQNRQDAYKKLRERNQEEVRKIQEEINVRELDEEMARREREQEEMLREYERQEEEEARKMEEVEQMRKLTEEQAQRNAEQAQTLRERKLLEAEQARKLEESNERNKIIKALLREATGALPLCVQVFLVFLSGFFGYEPPLWLDVREAQKLLGCSPGGERGPITRKERIRLCLRLAFYFLMFLVDFSDAVLDFTVSIQEIKTLASPFDEDDIDAPPRLVGWGIWLFLVTAIGRTLGGVFAVMYHRIDKADREMTYLVIELTIFFIEDSASFIFQFVKLKNGVQLSRLDQANIVITLVCMIVFIVPTLIRCREIAKQLPPCVARVVLGFYVSWTLYSIGLVAGLAKYFTESLTIPQHDIVVRCAYGIMVSFQLYFLYYWIRYLRNKDAARKEQQMLDLELGSENPVSVAESVAEGPSSSFSYPGIK